MKWNYKCSIILLNANVIVVDAFSLYSKTIFNDQFVTSVSLKTDYLTFDVLKAGSKTIHQAVQVENFYQNKKS